MVSIQRVISMAYKASSAYPSLTEEEKQKLRSQPLPERISPQKSKELPDLGEVSMRGVPDDVATLTKLLRGSRVLQDQRVRVIKKLKEMGEGGVLAEAYLAGGYTRGGGEGPSRGVLATRKKPLDPDSRKELISALGQIKGKEGDKALIKALDDQSAQVRETALQAVAYKGLKDAADEVALMLSKKEVERVIRSALETLGDLEVNSEPVVKALEDFLKVAEKKHVPGTSTTAGSGGMVVRAIHALGKIGGSQVSGKIKEILEKYARSDEEGFAMAAARYLPRKERAPQKELSEEEQAEQEAEMVHASITERLDRIASKVQVLNPDMALAIDRISDRLEGKD